MSLTSGEQINIEDLFDETNRDRLEAAGYRYQDVDEPKRFEERSDNNGHIIIEISRQTLLGDDGTEFHKDSKFKLADKDKQLISEDFSVGEDIRLRKNHGIGMSSNEVFSADEEGGNFISRFCNQLRRSDELLTMDIDTGEWLILRILHQNDGSGVWGIRARDKQ